MWKKIKSKVEAAVDEAKDIVEDFEYVVENPENIQTVLTLAQTASQAEANAEWKLWKKIKKEVKEVGNNIAGVAK